ncbi:MAG: alkaline phosphatase [Candidatus Scalindua sp.]|nr:alkaline phosphatase [Candidatus Scalindua sp.]
MITVIPRGAYNGVDGGDALSAAANNPGVTRLAGLFDHIYHTADDSGFAGTVTTNPNLENPTLVDSTNAALTVLGRNSNGFVLMIEGGAVDWAAHANMMDDMIGEKRDFDAAVQAVIDWVEDETNDSSWNNTLVIVTSDHETGYLTPSRNFITDTSDPRYDQNDPLGRFPDISDTTLALEKIVAGTGGLRASWKDSNSNNSIDTGETVYWVWNRVIIQTVWCHFLYVVLAQDCLRPMQRKLTHTAVPILIIQIFLM